MANAPPEIVRCPAELRTEALALVLCELSPSQRREVAASLLNTADENDLAREPLYVARRGDEIRGAVWGQRQPGNVAVFWPPQLAAGEDARIGYSLAEVVVRDLDNAAIVFAQSLLNAPNAETIDVLQHAGFRHLTDLLYLSCEATRFPQSAPHPCEIEFEEYATTQRARLIQVVESTYLDTLDCAALNGARDIDDVINGYQATGAFRPENWFIVRAGGADVGVLLLADHLAARHWELMYMGLVPEVRGRGWGRQIAQYAQWLGRRARVERILVAVDATNSPAAAVYRSTGFEIWERRAVYLRFQAKSH
jgi:ribosomal protein S18 acetylase RimI-like enzyme